MRWRWNPKPKLDWADRAVLAALVLALTMYDDDASVFAVLRAGARGYVLKGAHQAELVAAIRAVARGEAVFGAQVADRVLAHFATPPAQRPALPELTERERQILAMLAAGQTTSDIAAHLALVRKLSATTCPTSSPNCMSPTESRPSCAPARPGSSNRRRLPAARSRPSHHHLVPAGNHVAIHPPAASGKQSRTTLIGCR